MKLLVTTNARLYKTSDGKFWTGFVYGYEFFLRYLRVFEEVKLIAHVRECKNEDATNLVRVDGPALSVYEVPFPHGKLEYIKMYNMIRKTLKICFQDCDVAILRIPDQLAFQLYPYLRRNNIPVGVEVTSDSWDFFSPGAVKSKLRPLLRIFWHFQQKHLCKTALGASYVTKYAIQKRYPPIRAIKKDGFTTNYTNVNIDQKQIYSPRIYSVNQKKYTAIHVSGSIEGYAKGHKELIEAIGMLVEKNFDIHLVLVGSGNLSLDISSLIKKYRLEERIRYTGRLTTPIEIINELNKADIFVFPSYREGLPRVIIEAMACALPCVSTDIPGLNELLDKECLVPVKDSIALMKKIEELITDPSRLNQISKRNMEKAKEYSINNIEKKRTEFYGKLRNSVKRE
ncbi:glycosyltransferase family 4 protein [Tissierella creatinini]|nr:glycosyltransferase family 4 protein [Tissierella creatinini]TJX61547.1 glycosyltransferase family 4 protein [Soehngenia saccharolytica]